MTRGIHFNEILVGAEHYKCTHQELHRTWPDISLLLQFVTVGPFSSLTHY